MIYNDWLSIGLFTRSIAWIVKIIGQSMFQLGSRMMMKSYNSRTIAYKLIIQLNKPNLTKYLRTNRKACAKHWNSNTWCCLSREQRTGEFEKRIKIRRKESFLTDGWRSHSVSFWRQSNGTRSLTPLFTHLTLVNLFIKLKINILLLPPLAKYCFLLVPMQLLYAHMFGRF